MIRSMFSGVAGLRTHQSKMDVIGNNIANVNTYGYKAMRATFKDSIYSTSRSSSDGTATMGGRNASQIGYGSQIGSIDLLFVSGNFTPTDNPMDSMIEGQGLFLLGGKDLAFTVNDDGTVEDGFVQNASDDEAGDLDKFLYSRVGDFDFDGQGYLVNSDGYHVYGFQYDYEGDTNELIGEEAELRPLRIQENPEVDGARLNLGQISIDPNGVVSGINADDNKTVIIGKIAVANVPNPNGLEKTQGPYYRATANVGDVRAYAAGEGSTGKLQTNGLEMANVDLAKEFSDMITTQRGFQANTRIITVSDQMLEEMLAMKR